MVSKRENAAARRMAALAAAVALALGASACGGSDDSESGGAATAEQTVAASGPEGQIRAVYDEHVKALYAGQATKACATFSEAGRKILAAGKTCEDWFETTLASGELSPNKPFIVKLDVRGDRARGLVKTKNSTRYPITFVKEDDGWKIGVPTAAQQERQQKQLTDGQDGSS